jgi:hypothetical protein
VATVGAAFLNRNSLADTVGRTLDYLASPEDIVSKPVISLEPRLDDTPLVSPQPHSESTKIDLQFSYDQHEQGALLDLPPGISLQTEHTHSPIELSKSLSPAGTAIITTAEGLSKGDQEYCALFKEGEHVLAVGYTGGLYTYEHALKQGADGSTGEWVRVVTSSKDGDGPDSPVIVDTPWKDIEVGLPDMLIEKVTMGTKTLHDIGYKPWAAILPSTKMPGMKHMELNPASCAQTIEEVTEHTLSKSFFISEHGDLVDINHLQAKAGETLALYTQLYYQHLTNEPHPKARVAYARGSKASFSFSVDPESLNKETLQDTTFAIMNTTSVLMEGVSQQYGNEKIPLANAMWPSMGGMNPEDLFTNSLGITGMLSLISQPEVAKSLERSLETLHRDNPRASADVMSTHLKKIAQEANDILIKHVVAQTAHSLGVRPQPTAVTVELPRGIYPLIPIKVANEDAATPTHLNVRALDIQPDNPNTRFKIVHVPAMQSAAERALGKLGL